MEQKEKDKRFISYPVEDAEFRPVVSIGGREYAVVPMMTVNTVSQEMIDFQDRHGLDGLGKQLDELAKSFVQDIAMHLYHAAAFTATKDDDPDDLRLRRVNMYLPILLPVDERDRWCLSMTDEQDAEIQQAAAERINSGKPRAAKIVEWKEDDV